MKIELNEKLKDNRKKDFWRAIGEQDIMKLRRQLEINNRSQLTKNR